MNDHDDRALMEMRQRLDEAAKKVKDVLLRTIERQAAQAQISPQKVAHDEDLKALAEAVGDLETAIRQLAFVLA